MKKLLYRIVLAILAVLMFVPATVRADKTVTIKDIHGDVEVPVSPERVIALDNRTFETLEAWGVKPIAVPKDVMSSESGFVKDDSIENIGDHREPKLELLAALDPQLVIVGQRFAKYYDEIKKLVPNATVIDFSFDVSEEAKNAGENLVNGLKDATTALGQIFEKEAEAKALIDAFDEKLAAAKEAYPADKTVLSIVVSGGEIGFSAPHSGRVFGPLYDIFGWKPAIEVDHASSDHKGDDISVEAIADSNPDYLFVLDRDAAVQSVQESKPATDVIEGTEALKNTTAVKEGHILYAPNDTYTNESIQTFTEIFEQIANMFKGQAS